LRLCVIKYLQDSAKNKSAYKQLFSNPNIFVKNAKSNFMKRLTTLALLCLTLLNFTTAQYAPAWSTSETAFLGIESNHISEAKAKALGFENPHGRYVTKVVKNSAAEKAGLQPFDYVFAIDKYNLSEDEDLTDILEKYKPTDKATIHFIRNGKKQTAEVNFVQQGGAITANEKAYLGVSPHSDEDEDELGIKIYVLANGTAEAMGLQDGDLITAINGMKMVDWDDLTIAINQLKAGDKIAIEYERDRKKMRAEQPIKSQAESKKYTTWNSNWNPDDAAHLGIYSNSVDEEKAEKLGFANKNGSYVTRIIGNTAAEKAGLQPFDYVYGVNDYRTNEDVSLTEILKKFKTGDKVTVHFIRNGVQKTAEVAFLKRSESKTNISEDKCEAPFLGVQRLDTEAEGVSVEVVEKSTAADMGLKEGDVVTKINGRRIVDWDGVTIAIDNMKVGETISVEYLRDGKKQTASKPIKSYCETRPNESRYGFNMSENENNNDNQRVPESERIMDVNVANAIVDMKEMDAVEAGEFKNRFGIEMLSANDLKVEKLSVAPNAGEDKFQLQFNLPEAGETSIRIYNSAGRMIYNYDLGNFSGDFMDQVNISQNGVGNYFLEIRQGGKSVTKKVILQSR